MSIKKFGSPEKIKIVKVGKDEKKEVKKNDKKK